MTSETRVPKAEITGVYGALLKTITKKMLGQVPDSLAVMWHSRPVLTFGIGLGRKSSKWNDCDQHLKSYAHMAVAALIGCSFCLDWATSRCTTRGSTRPRRARCPGGGSRSCSRRWSVTC
jgi:hypothetical protein